jgi:hypothetical protein
MLLPSPDGMAPLLCTMTEFPPYRLPTGAGREPRFKVAPY